MGHSFFIVIKLRRVSGFRSSLAATGCSFISAATGCLSGVTKNTLALQTHILFLLFVNSCDL